MIELTIGDLLEERWPDDLPDSLCLYVIRDHESDLVFYVGKSTRDVILRLIEHLGLGHRYKLAIEKFADNVGQFVLYRLPRSRAWKVQLYTIEEASNEQYTFSGESWRDLPLAEETMIRRLRPCLNVTHNSDGRGLPVEYLDPSIYLAGLVPEYECNVSRRRGRAVIPFDLSALYKQGELEVDGEQER